MNEHDKAVEETEAILSDPDLMQAIRNSEQQIADGKVVSWDAVKADLGLDRSTEHNGRRTMSGLTNMMKAIQSSAILAQMDGGRVDRLRLLNLLYIADREALAERGSPIVGGHIVARDTGPLHSNVYDLIQGAHQEYAAWSEFFENEGHVVVLKADPGRDELSPFEIEKLTAVSELRRTVDSWAVAEETHKFPEWQECHIEGSSKTIPLDNILAAVGFDADDIAFILNEAAVHRRLRRTFA